MTPEDRAVLFDLVIVPGRGSRRSPEDALRYFGVTDGTALSLRLLRDAAEARDPVDVDAALIACAAFGVTAGHLAVLVALESATWHQGHEDVVAALGRLRSPEVVPSLLHAAQWVPDYLEFDESRALAVKAIWALGATPGPEALGALRTLLANGDERVRDTARAQLARRGEI